MVQVVDQDLHYQVGFANLWNLSCLTLHMNRKKTHMNPFRHSYHNYYPFLNSHHNCRSYCSLLHNLLRTLVNYQLCKHQKLRHKAISLFNRFFYSRTIQQQTIVQFQVGNQQEVQQVQIMRNYQIKLSNELAIIGQWARKIKRCICVRNFMRLINIIQLMKPEKITKQRRELSQGLPAIENTGFNQTIIINNPNFNINYIDHSAYNAKPNSRQNNNKTIAELPMYDPKNSSKGVQAWNLNKNLKEFSQTKQLGFFKGNGIKTKSNADIQHSPYLSHKTKTQQIKAYIKIKPTGIIQPSSFRENKTIPTIKNQVVHLTQRDRSVLSHHAPILGTLQPQDQSKTTFRKRKFQSRSKNPKPIAPQFFQTMEPYTREAKQGDLSQTIPNNGFQTQRRMAPIPLTTRRNRFIQIEKPITTKQISDRKNHQNQQDEELSDLQNSLIIDSPRKTKTPNEPISANLKHKNRVYEKSIQKISKCFLSKVDNYFDQPKNVQIPSSKIELYATTVQQPVSYSYNIDYKSTSTGLAQTAYDFNFEEEKTKARPKTPYKRKKMYQQVA